MSQPKRITHQFLEAVQIADSRFDRLYIPMLMLLGIAYAGYQAIQGDWLELVLFAPGVVLMFALAIVRPLQRGLLRQRMNRRHATYVALYGLYSAVFINLARALSHTEPIGKQSGVFYALAILAAAFTVMLLRALATLTPLGYRVFVTKIPLWEQALIAVNEMIAAGLLAAYVGTTVLTHVLQPQVFTTRVDVAYTAGITAMLVLYYLGMQLMWIQRWNDWLSQNRVWVRLTRVVAPLMLLVMTMIIARRLIERAEPRTADLLDTAGTDLSILSLGAVAWLVILILIFLVYTGRRGLRQRFLPDDLLERVPTIIARFLRSISDMDMLLIIVLLGTFVPAYLFLLGDPGGIIGTLRGQILERGSALIETSEQALALVFAIPFYGLAVALLALYAYVFSLPSLSAQERDELVASLPVGFLIVLIITLYLFAIPVSQVLTEGRLPQLPQDLGRILAFNVLIPLALLYAHYFLLVRWPYGRGQARWREAHNLHLLREQEQTDRRIEALNGELDTLDLAWRDQTSPTEVNGRFDTLFRYMQLNSLRDDLNMQRLQIVASRQQLTEVSEAPVSIAVARLPLRVVSLGIPLLIAIQIYQWAILNNGLREIINTPNITVDQFFRIILKQANF
jgi:hypothetical protein